MFRAYSNIPDSIGGETAETWTEIKSFPQVALLKDSPQSYIIVSSSESETSSEPEIKIIKKSKKKSKKRKKHKKNKYFPEDGSRKLEKILFDDEYQKFFSQFSKDEIKKFNFYDQIPQLKPRNAFRLDKKGDPNNLSSEQTYFKFRPKYNEPFDGRNKSTRISKKRLRREMIKKLNQKRYFVRANFIKPEDVVCKSAKSLSESTLTNKMWVYLEMKNDLEEQESNIDLTSDYMKHLNENRHDIDKWLEFIEYQDKALNLRLSGQIKNMSSILFERKKSIFERAISENPLNFHLRMEYLKLRAGSIEMMTQYDSVDLMENEFYALLEFEAKNEANWKNLYEIWFELIKFFTNNNLSMVSVNRIQLVYKKSFNFFIYSKIEKTPDYLNNYCGFLRNCGYLEKAIGIFQAIIDFNFTTSKKQSLNYFGILLLIRLVFTWMNLLFIKILDQSLIKICLIKSPAIAVASEIDKVAPFQTPH
ncbi:NRDE2 -like protein [Brachionus plicatilis]|uniref:NRDE2-like protein n=1 Tax=Brachionus plicatilis TaxID=10195 RepID=A0A3M7PU89_BRAPC|nr:NRDE2 -like protein [Brachionus plicatilis]